MVPIVVMSPNGGESAGIGEDFRALVAEQKRSRSPRIGFFAERLYAEGMEARGHRLETLHADGADFLVDGAFRVDVKARILLDDASGSAFRKTPSSQRIAGVDYAYVLFFADLIQVVNPDGIGEGFTLAWDSAAAAYERYRRTKARGERLATPPAATQQRAVRKDRAQELRRWIAERWGLRAKVVLRSNRRAQEAMSRRGWGPEAFYQPPERGVDVVVLIYFDDVEVYRVLAYPMAEHGAIAWRDKMVGPNPSGRRTFDPQALDPRFEFASLDELRQDFPLRFPGVIRAGTGADRSVAAPSPERDR